MSNLRFGLMSPEIFMELLPRCQEFCTSDQLRHVSLPTAAHPYQAEGRSVYGNIATPFEVPNQPGVGVRLRYLLSAIDSGSYSHFVDVGCGTGTILRLAKHLQPSIQCIGIEYDSDSAEIARRSNPQFQVWTGDALQYPDYQKAGTIIYVARPFVGDRDQGLLEDRILDQLGEGSVLISLLPASSRLVSQAAGVPVGVFQN